MEQYLYGIIFEDEFRNIYAFGSHQHALYYWTKAISANKLKPAALLIHIDHHADFLSPANTYSNVMTPEEIDTCIRKRKIGWDTFIRPALTMGIINDVAFCCPPSRNNEVANFSNYETPMNIVDNLRKYLKKDSLPDREKKHCDYILTHNLILDIDLDFFLTDENGYLVPKTASLIQEEIAVINELYNYAAVTTITTSPDVGNKAKGYQRQIQEMFSKYFSAGIDITKQPAILDL